MWQPGWFIEDFVVSKSAIVDVRDKSRRTPLAYAALYNNNSAVVTLIDLGAKIDYKDSNGNTPLHQALDGSAETSSLLIRSGARLTTLDGFHQTCLQLAIRSEKSDIIDTVLSYTYPRDEPRRDRIWGIGSSIATQMIQNQDCHGKTALHRLCAGHASARTPSSKTALFHQVQLLIRAGAAINAQDKFRYTPAHLAAIGNNLAALDSLLDFDPDLSLLDHHGCTAVDWALVQGQLAMVEMMREVGGQVTKGYAAKLGAYQRVPDVDLTAKHYDLGQWALARVSYDRRTGTRIIEAW